MEPVQHPAQRAALEIATWQEYRVKAALGKTFRSTASRIVVRKPGWMPWRLFSWLMRCIVIEEREAPAPVVQRLTRRDIKRRIR